MNDWKTWKKNWLIFFSFYVADTKGSKKNENLDDLSSNDDEDEASLNSDKGDEDDDEDDMPPVSFAVQPDMDSDNEEVNNIINIKSYMDLSFLFLSLHSILC